jgi:energy-coupling factor transporter ATP-binding protein EcfA2
MSEIYFSFPTGVNICLAGVRADDVVDLLMAAYVPGSQRVSKKPKKVDLVVSFPAAKKERVVKKGRHLFLYGPWGSQVPLDAYHLVYSIVRHAFLKHRLYPAHAACLTNPKGEGVLIVGHSGVGKTSVALDLVMRHGWKLFSGNKTTVTCRANALVATAGTRTMTIRDMERKKYERVIFAGKKYGARLAFSLDDQMYEQSSSLKIKSILLVRLNDGVRESRELSPLGALHTLYPFFLDAVNADTVLAGGSVVFSGETPQGVRESLARTLSKTLPRIPVHALSGPMKYLTEQMTRL